MDLDDPSEANNSQVCYFILQGNEEGYFRLDPETHVLTVERQLDRELIANFTLYVKATENCANDTLLELDTTTTKSQQLGLPHSEKINYDRFKHSRQLRVVNMEYEMSTSAEPDLVSYENYSDEKRDPPKLDSTIVCVKVRVLDINDNPPRFRSKIFTGGITTNADFGLRFMRVEATDPDEGANAKISYYQVGEIRQTLSEGLENVRKAPFLIDQDTGEVQLNFDPQKGMKGYFDFMVLANDSSGMRDVAHVFIYLLREDQKVRFVFRLQPDELRARIDTFRE